MNRKILLKAGALALAASFLLTACNSGDSGRSGRRGSRDGEGVSWGGKNPTDETSETNETADPEPLPPEVSSQVINAYLDVLSDYDDAIFSYEEEIYSFSCPSINYLDLDGDGIEELIFKYESEQYCVNLAIYHYDTNSGTVVNWFDQTVETPGSWGMDCDAVYLNNGDLLIVNFYGSRDDYYQTMEEYALTNDGFNLCNTWEINEIIEDGQNPQSDSFTPVPVEATFNGGVVPTDDFYEAQADYYSSIKYPVMPYSSRVDYDGFEISDIFDRPFNNLEGSVFSAGNYMYYSDFAAMAGVTVAPANSQQGWEACYRDLLISFQVYMLQLEESTMSFPSTALYDLTGDGIPELLISYDYDWEAGYYDSPDGTYRSAAMRIYTYNVETDMAEQMLFLPNSVVFASAGQFTDVVVLDDGTVLFAYSNGGLESFTYTYDLYEVADGQLELISTLKSESDIIDWDEETYEYTYTLNGDTITEREFNNQLNTYMDSAVELLTTCPWYNEDPNNRDWENLMLELPNASHTYSEAEDILNAVG